MNKNRKVISIKMKILVVFAVLICVFIVTVICEESEDEAKCKPGEFFHDGCNMCFCHKLGLSCTLKYCHGNLTPPKLCTPGTTFKQRCNSCICNERGNGGTCTTQKCDEEDNSNPNKSGN